MDEKNFKIFIDFDGTITKVDVGSAIFEKFGEPNAVAEVIKKYLDDNVTAKECWLLLFNSVKNLDRNEFDKIFKKEKLEDLKYYSNKLLFDEHNNMTPVFPYLDEESRSSANCKHNHIISHSADEEFTVYIGDGVSDKETAQYCDFIFAKDDLLKFCEKERITYFPYKNFHDVIKKLDELKSKKKLKKRHQASLKRREVYLRG
jgi:2-hydroxy-3-keto-5-methylthiopentenyl-1-phosphate phosphatase